MIGGGSTGRDVASQTLAHPSCSHIVPMANKYTYIICRAGSVTLQSLPTSTATMSLTGRTTGGAGRPTGDTSRCQPNSMVMMQPPGEKTTRKHMVKSLQTTVRVIRAQGKAPSISPLPHGPKRAGR